MQLGFVFDFLREGAKKQTFYSPPLPPYDQPGRKTSAFFYSFPKNAAPRLEVRPSKKTSEIKVVFSRFPLIRADSMKVNLGFQENSSCITIRKIIVGHNTHT